MNVQRIWCRRSKSACCGLIPKKRAVSRLHFLECESRRLSRDHRFLLGDHPALLFKLQLRLPGQ
jgi:hypothetical protein